MTEVCVPDHRVLFGDPQVCSVHSTLINLKTPVYVLELGSLIIFIKLLT